MRRRTRTARARPRPRETLVLVVLVASLVSSGCGSGSSGGLAASVGKSRVEIDTVSHWMSVLAPEHEVPDPPSYKKCVARQLALEPGSASSTNELKRECAQQYDQLRAKALTLLITSRWLTGEAAREGVRPSAAEVDQADASRFQDLSSADARFVAEAERSADRVRAKVIATTVSPAAVAGYYRRHRARFLHPEQRETYIVEHVPTAVEAARLRAAVVAGKKSIVRLGLHEFVTDEHPAETVPGKRALARAIFTARPGVVTPVFMFDRQYTFLVVKRVVGSFVDPLARVESAIHDQLAARAQADFLARWRREWRARTDCEPGYVVAQCRQYRGGESSPATLALPE
jgi:hypothetical protein